MNKVNKTTNYKTLTEVIKERESSNNFITFIKECYDDKIFFYKDIYYNALKVLGYLQKMNMQQGEELVFQLNDNLDFITAFWACLLGGIIPVPITVGNNDEHKQKLLNIWQILNNPCLIVDQTTYGRLNNFFKNNLTEDSNKNINERIIYMEDAIQNKEFGKESNPVENDIAFIQFSSGSTGSPKGVILTHKNLLTNIKAIINGIKSPENGDLFFSWMPLTHDMGLIGFHLTPLVRDWNHYIMSTELFIRRPMLWLQKISQYKITFTASPNFGYNYVLKRLKPREHENIDLSSVRIITNGAEPISIELCHEFSETMSSFGLKPNVIFPVYGLAEASLAVTFSNPEHKINVHSLNRKQVNIGRKIEYSDNDNSSTKFVEVGSPIENCNFRVINSNSEEVGEEIVGYIEIKGDNVTRGYYNNSIATNKVIAKTGWLWTGDLGFVKDGKLVITGRAKDIIFINGQNYYPQDLERVAEEINEIELGNIVFAGFYDVKLQKDLVIAFLRFKKNINQFAKIALELKTHINQKINIEIDKVIPINSIPKTTSGKIQRFKLLKLYEEGNFENILKELNDIINEKHRNKEITLPENETEKKLVDLCKNVFEKNNIGTTDNFFEFGGNSLKASYFCSLISKNLNVNIEIQDIFENPTIKRLSEFIDGTEKKTYIPIPQAKKKDCYPVSSAQKRMFILSHQKTIGLAYNISEVIFFKGILDYKRLEKAFLELIHRHDGLRTSFDIKHGNPVQIVHNAITFVLEEYQCKEEEVDSKINDYFFPFNLETPPLIRACLIEISDERHYLLLDMHHIIADGTSINIFIKELFDLYNGKALSPLNIDYKDYSEWQNGIRSSNYFQQQKDYWKNNFINGAPQLNMPLDYRRPATKQFKGGSVCFNIDREKVAELEKFSFQNNLTVHMLMFSAYTILLSKYSEQNEIIVGSLTAGRNHIDLEKVFGMFVNFLPIRNKTDDNATLLQTLNSIKNNLLDAYRNQNVMFEEMIEDLQISTDSSRNHLFDAAFIFHNELDLLSKIKIDNLRIKRIKINKNSSLLDLKMDVFLEDDGELSCCLEYDSMLFKEETINNMINDFLIILNKILINSNGKLGNLNLFGNKKTKELIERREMNNIINKDSINIVIASTFTADPVKDYIEYWCNQFDLSVQIINAPYNQVFQELIENESIFSKNSGINLLMIRFEDWIRYDNVLVKKKCEKLENNYNYLLNIFKNKNREIPYFVAIFPVSSQSLGDEELINCIEKLYNKWKMDIEKLDGVYLINFRELKFLYNVENVFDSITDREGHLPFSDEFYASMGTYIARKIYAYFNQRYKVIVIDCDNTLWKGVCGEDGFNGIEISEPYRELQSFMLLKYNEGFLLTLCSKNNESDVWAVFDKRQDMILKKEHFVSCKINWNEKSKNIKEMSKELNVGLDSFIFIDDNPMECEEVLINAKEVLSLNLPKKSKDIPNFLRHVWAFDKLKVTEEDKSRSQMYFVENTRKKIQEKSGSINDFIKNLEIKVTMRSAEENDISRISQLTQRTNQFNLSVIRRSENEIKKKLYSADCNIWSIDVADRFGEYGLVGVVITEFNNKLLFIDTFLLSCRVLGRKIEYVILNGIKQFCSKKNIDIITARYIETKQNKPIYEFIKTSGWEVSEKYNDGTLFFIKTNEIKNIDNIDFNLGNIC